MFNLSFKKKIIITIVAIGLILIALLISRFFNFKQGSNNQQQDVAGASEKKPDPSSSQDEPMVISTKPDPLEGETLLPTQTIEINFNRSLQNEPETRVTIEPKIDVKKELTNDRKTLKITPIKSFILGNGYTLFIKGETKFDGNKTLGHDEIYHFKTIGYSGV